MFFWPAGWHFLSEPSIYFFGLLCIFLSLILVSLFSGWYGGRGVQFAFPGVTSARIEQVFVDSGAFPEGIYNERSAFIDLDQQGFGTRICGLFGSDMAQKGTVSMWIPTVHPSRAPTWHNVVLKNQLYQRKATINLFSTNAVDNQGAVPFLTRHSHCIVFRDGGVAPLAPVAEGLFLQVVFAPPDACPPDSLIPSHVTERDVFALCRRVAPSLSGAHALAVAPLRSSAQVPKLNESELNAWRMMGFPFNRQWRWAYDATIDHGLEKVPTPVHMFTDLHVLPARMRALPFARLHTPRLRNAVGALIHIDFHTGLPPSRPHGFLHHCSLLDDASRFGRMYPRVSSTAQDALECLGFFLADLQRETRTPITFLVVRGDNVPFGSQQFKEGCAKWKTGPIHVELTGFYAHEQAGNIERFHGVRMSTGRVLLRYAMLPFTWWPFATNQANMIHNMLPSSANRSCAPLSFLRGAKVSWKAERMGVFGHFAMVWLAPPQRGETSKQLADRARPAIYLGRAARLDNASSLDSHFFMTDTEEFHRATHFMLDYSRPPPGWPFRAPGDRARSVDVLSELLALPESFDVGTYLVDELPLPGAVLPDYADEEGAAPSVVPDGLLNSLPNADPVPIISDVSTRFPVKTFDLTPPSTGSEPSPADPAFLDQLRAPDEPPLRLPVPARAPVRSPVIPGGAPDDALDREPDAFDADPLGRPGPARLESHGTDAEWHPRHCSTAGCEFPRGHSPPCSNHLPNSGRDYNPDAPRTLRPRSRGNFTTQERSNLAAFAFRVLALAAVGTADHVAQEGGFPRVGHIPGTLFLTAFDNTLFVAQPGQDETAASIPIPRGVRQALASERREFWLEAIFKEYSSILSHNVFSVVRRCDVPPGSDVMRNHCVFTVKSNSDGSIERYKCRLVCDGNTQTFGVNFVEIFSTVVKFSTFRMALHLAAVRDYNITAIDISTAFLYGEIDNPNCYMEMPEGLPRYDENGDELVCHLLKSIYGLRQAPRIWFNHFKASLEAFGFVQSNVDPCLFIYEHESTVIYGLLWVDDLVLMTNDDAARNRLVTFLRETRKYTLTDKGEATWLLGIALTRDREKRTITLSQALYIQTMLARFSVYINRSNCRQFDIPATDELNAFHSQMGPEPGSAEAERMRPLLSVYLQIIGSLIWLTSCTLPHLCVATNVLSRFSINPSEQHWSALMRVLLYIQKHPDESLTLGGTGPDAEVLRIITDASHEEHASISGVLIVMGCALIDWICRRQKTTSRSSLESEAKANAEGAQDGIHKRELGKEFRVKVTTTDFFTDSDSSVKLHKDQYACKKSKHIIRVISMLRQWILNLVYTIRHIAGVKNYADILTKALGLEPFARFRDAMLNAKIILPTEAKSITQAYITRIAEYLSHANSLDDSATSCLCPGKTNHCDESDLCSSHCYTCFDDSVALSLPVSAGGGVKPWHTKCCNG